jgi:hypothetical protein
MADPEDQIAYDERRRLLDLLASAEDGCTAELILALGFETGLLLGVVIDGLATSVTKRVLAGGREVDVTKVLITDAGQRVLGKR